MQESSAPSVYGIHGRTADCSPKPQGRVSVQLSTFRASGFGRRMEEEGETPCGVLLLQAPQGLCGHLDSLSPVPLGAQWCDTVLAAVSE